MTHVKQSIQKMKISINDRKKTKVDGHFFSKKCDFASKRCLLLSAIYQIAIKRTSKIYFKSVAAGFKSKAIQLLLFQRTIVDFQLIQETYIKDLKNEFKTGFSFTSLFFVRMLCLRNIPFHSLLQHVLNL